MRISKQTIGFVAALVVTSASVAALSLRGEPPRRLRFDVNEEKRPKVKPAELAQWIVEGRRDFAIVDLRAPADYEKAHVRGAVHCGTCHENRAEGQKHQEGDMFVDLSKKLVLYTETGKEPIELPKILAKNPRLYLLDGGFAGWREDVLSPVPFGGETDEAQLDAKKKREALRAFFAGERANTATPARLPLVPIQRDNAHKPATREGC